MLNPSHPPVSRTQSLRVHLHRCKPNQASGRLIEKEPGEHCCGKIWHLVSPRSSTPRSARWQSPSESQNSMWHPPVGQQHLLIAEPVTGRGGCGGAAPAFSTPLPLGSRWHHIGMKRRKLSLAQCLSQEVFPAGLPTYHPRKPQTWASSWKTSSGPTCGQHRRLRAMDHDLSLGDRAGRWGVAEAKGTHG